MSTIIVLIIALLLVRRIHKNIPPEYYDDPKVKKRLRNGSDGWTDD